MSDKTIRYELNYVLPKAEKCQTTYKQKHAWNFLTTTH